jgi:hypothetical protein
MGWCHRLGWDEGVHLLLAVTPTGGISGSGVGPANTAAQRLAETLLAARAGPPPRLPAVGQALGGNSSVVATGFEGPDWLPHWRRDYGAQGLCPPKPSHPQAWPPRRRRWFASIRQIVETVNSDLLAVFGLAQERPHTLTGFRARLAARVALPHFCCWLNQHLGRPLLAFADRIDW